MRCYVITSSILCHDGRSNNSGAAIATIAHAPADECLRFIYEAACLVVGRASGEGCPYGVSAAAVRVLPA